MKKRIIICTIASLVVFCGSSVWEGAAAVASDGILPQTGFYAATNSFPRNTVVDVVNLENDKSVRVTVASGLDTPGLLAILSVDAANIIGLSNRSIGRISMSQPSDPIAFSRFTETIASEMEVNESPDTPLDITETPHDSEVAIEPEWIEEGSWVIADADDYFTEDYFTDEYFFDEFEAAADAGVYLSEADIAPVDTFDEDETYVESLSFLPETEEYTTAGEVILVEETVNPAEVAASPGDYTYHLVPADERPPDTSAIYIIDSESIIPGISSGEHKEEIEDHYYKSIMDSLLTTIDPPAAVERTDVLPFSVPVISSLESGRYYVQLGAYSSSDYIDIEINQIDKSYPLALFNDGKADNSVYRIILGPMNQGESGAVLRRFKTIGYKDAFIRRGN